MLVTKCDLCQQTITDVKERVRAGYGLEMSELCSSCGAPVLKFLLRTSLLPPLDRISQTKKQ